MTCRDLIASLPPLPSFSSTLLSRRRALQAFAIGGVGTAGLVLASSPAAGQSSIPCRFIAGDLQVVTVTESGLTVTWCTWSTESMVGRRPTGVDTEGTLKVWAVDNPSDAQEVASEKATSFHVLTVSDLRPGTEYRFEASSEGMTPVPVANLYEAPFNTLTTMSAPAGALAGTMVVTNDVHIGEEQDGIIVSDFPPPAVQTPGQRPYAEIMLESVIAGAHAAGASQLYINGDVTAEARPTEVATAKRILDTFNGKWRVTRGNHDRPHDATGDADYASAPVYRGPDAGGPGTDYRDSFGKVFEPRQEACVQDGPGDVRVLGIDSSHRDESGGVINESQFHQIEGILQDDPERPTVVMLHHPMTRDAQWTNIGGPTYTLKDANAQRLQAMFAAAPGVKLVLSGHTHRARRNSPDEAAGPNPPVFLETASAKNSPTGAIHLRVFGDQILVNFRHAVSSEALAWAQKTRWAMFDLQSAYSLGHHTSRNLVVRL